MNIVALNSSKNWGGNERWLTTALNGLSSKGHQIHLIKRHNTDHWNSLSSSINVIEAPFTNELSIKTKAIIRNTIKERNSDILLSTKRKDYVLGAQIKKKNNISHIMRLGISRPILKRDVIQRYVISKKVDPCLSETYSFDEIGHAHQLMHDNKHPHGNMACLVNALSKGEGRTS